MIEKEYGFFSDKFLDLPEIDIKKYNEPKKITNSIIDFDPNSTHSLANIVPYLTQFLCEALEIRYFYSLTCKELEEQLKSTNGSTLRDVEVLVEFNESYTVENILQLRQQYSRLRKLTLFNSAYNKILEHEELYVIYTKDSITSQRCCGVVSSWYFISKTESFIEAVSFNSCLNKKFSIDSQGNIKNCPSMNTSYGKISDSDVLSIIKSENYQSWWHIKKDQIEVCKDCEFRYICQDCRAHIVDENNIYSKPSKCKYNPYE